MLPIASLVLSAVLLSGLSGCNAPHAPNAGKTPKADAGTPHQDTPPVVTSPNAKSDTKPAWTGAPAVLAARNTDVSACDDFYEYACGGWIERMRAEQAARPWSRSFSVVKTRTNGELLAILEGPRRGATADAGRRNLEKFYASCMDTDAIDIAKAKPLAATLSEIEAVSNRDDYYVAVAKAQTTGVPALFLLSVGPDAKEPRRNLPQLYQAGLGMPGPTLYTSPKLKAIRDGYRRYMVALHELIGLTADQAQAVSQRVLSFEQRLSAISVPPAQAGDSSKNYNPVAADQLVAAAPGLPWLRMFSAMDLAMSKRVNLKTPGFFAKLGKLVADTDIQTLKEHLRWQTLNASASLLGKPFFEANYAFNIQQLAGDTRSSDRQLFCIERVKNGLGDLLARYYVQDNYDPRTRPQVDALLSGLRSAFLAGLAEADWMTPATRKRAQDKAKLTTWQIGAPTEAIDYGGLPPLTGAFFTDAMGVNRFQFRDQMAKADGPVARDQWYAPAYVANAYYDPTQNNLVVPAGIIQEPFLSAAAPAIFNYAALGMILGHEFTHGFDSNGARYTADGKLDNWWDASSMAGFQKRTACMVKQYGTYKVAADTKQPPAEMAVNGESTLNENIADNGGLHLAWRSFQSWRGRQEPRQAVSPVPGLSVDQLFFVAFAQQWCTIETPDTLRQTVLTNVHAPPRFRVNGVVSNMPEFATAFSCPPQRPMNPATRCDIW